MIQHLILFIEDLNYCDKYLMNSNHFFQRIELFISAKDIRDLEVFSKSDPYCKVSYKKDFNHSYDLLGKT